MDGAMDDLGRNHSVFQDLLFMINVAQEKVQRRDPLRESTLDVEPLV